MKEFYREMILPQFGGYSYIREVGSKPKLISFCIRDSITIFKKETNILIDSFKLNINNIDRINIIVG